MATAINIRNQILDMLESQRASTVDQLSRALRVTPADIRHHLANLKQEGVIEQAGAQAKYGRGRPRQIWRLAAAARPDNLAGLGRLFLEINRINERDPGLSAAARLLAGPATREPGQLPARRFYLAIQKLNELHYKARWEAHADSPRILLGNCPYAALVGEYPELCQMDASLLAELCGQPATQTAKLEPNPLGALQCVFHLAVQP